MKQLFLIICFGVLLSACGHMPKHDTKTSSTDPLINVNNAPLGAEVIVDGKIIGIVAEKLTRFAAPSGTHTVSVVSVNGQVLYKAEVYLAKNITKEISIP